MPFLLQSYQGKDFSWYNLVHKTKNTIMININTRKKDQEQIGGNVLSRNSINPSSV